MQRVARRETLLAEMCAEMTGVLNGCHKYFTNLKETC